ncbi:hypothetical protein B4Q13_18710, partial [Lacticaseibacillus rhamnosus]
MAMMLAFGLAFEVPLLLARELLENPARKDLRHDGRDLRGDKRDLRGDRRDARQDSTEVRGDRRELRQDRRELRRDKRGGALRGGPNGSSAS